ncbi:MAG: acyl-CoA dehydrogenase [Euryarchaeota archaeon]|jgi:acyl-CoA dehydrogenase|nr:acyl-CoA dehydrogenase [Euryarchaeota archaeon]HJL97818.1 acyl-CoA dehydrogenase family protein [Candidatus Poseidoniaceae archaeon]MBT5594222.1 acyl-CoA dehydrogenase [Euryarchaeota archaeon]MBT5844915.1 acyl-CoA dehydrogenase [Euryarchaeota archaeon]MBT6640511.1 acyl-CoA dehydrogenase [Euryarchaeota archaeon]
MVNFQLDEMQEMLRELAHEFAVDEIRPNAEHWDTESVYPKEAIRAAHEMGLLNLHISEDYGGPGLGSMEEVLVNEELAWGDPGFATAAYATSLACAPIITGATEEQKQKWLRMVAEDGALASYAVTEPGAGSDVAACKTSAIRDGDEYIINGSKMWITGAGYADFFFVLAKTDVDAGYKGMSGFIVEKDAEGFSLGKKETNMGQRCSDTRSIQFDDVRVSADQLIGGSESGGWMNAMKAFDMSRPNIAAHATGLARAAYEHALQYSGERSTFGKPLHRHQAIQFMLADMKTKIEASRLLTWRSAADSDAGLQNTESAAHAKRFAADTAMEVSTDAVQVYGGYGYSEEYPVARLMRAAKVMQIYEGSSQVQRMIIGREITKDL